MRRPQLGQRVPQPQQNEIAAERGVDAEVSSISSASRSRPRAAGRHAASEKSGAAVAGGSLEGRRRVVAARRRSLSAPACRRRSMKSPTRTETTMARNAFSARISHEGERNRPDQPAERDHDHGGAGREYRGRQRPGRDRPPAVGSKTLQEARVRTCSQKTSAVDVKKNSRTGKIIDRWLPKG